jgi:hypothetical protein
MKDGVECGKDGVECGDSKNRPLMESEKHGGTKRKRKQEQHHVAATLCVTTAARTEGQLRI